MKKRHKATYGTRNKPKRSLGGKSSARQKAEKSQKWQAKPGGCSELPAEKPKASVHVIESHFVSQNGLLDFSECLRDKRVGLIQGGVVLLSASKMEWDGPIA